MRRSPVTAVLSTISARSGRRDQAPRRRRSVLAPLFDSLEVRDLMAGGGLSALALPDGSSLKSAIPIALQPLLAESVDNVFNKGTGQDYWRFHLNKGDFIGLELKTPDPSDIGQIKILDAGHNVVAASKPGADSTLAFDARSTGTYYVQISNKTPNGEKVTDTLTVREFALNAGKPLPPSPNDGTDHRWSWVSGKTLYITDDNGTGYGIKANWHKTVTTDPTTGMKEASYSTDGKMTIDVMVPQMKAGPDGTMVPTGKMQDDPITLTGKMDVATNPGVWGSMVGTIATTSLTSRDSLNTPAPATSSAGITAQAVSAVGTVHAAAAAASGSGATLNATTLLNSFSQMYGINATGSGVNFGMDQGSNLGYLGAPLNPNETYFFATYNSGPSASFGGISASASGASTYTLIIDPADPFVYVNVGPVTFGGSLKGMIPFQPTASNYAGPTFSGNLYGKVTGVQLGDLPVSLDGSATISLDPNHTGHPLGTNGNAASFFTTTGIKNAFNNIAVGVTGTANLGYSTGGVDFTIPVGTASAGYLPMNKVEQLQLKPGQPSFIYNIFPAVKNPGDPLFEYFRDYTSYYNDVFIDRPNYSFGVAGMTVNPLAGTPLESFFTGSQYGLSANSTGSSSTDLLNNLTVSATYMRGGGPKLFGYQLGQNNSLAITANHNSINLNASIGAFVGQVNINGTLNLHTGGFDLKGTLDPSDFPLSDILNTSSGSLELAYNTPGVANGLRANVNLGFSHYTHITVLGTFGVSGNVGGSITIDTSNSNYGGSLYANGSLEAFSHSISGSISASISGKTITVHTPIPHFGDFSFDI